MTWPKVKPPTGPPSANGYKPDSGSGVAPPSVPARVREAAAPRRLPGKVVAIAIAIVLVGGIVVAGGVKAFNKRVSVLVMADDVQAGSTIHGSDLTTANITKDPNMSTIPSSQESSVIGMTAASTLTQGSTVTRADLTRGTGFGTGQVLVPLAAKDGQLPAQGLRPGEKVLVTSTIAPGSAPSTAAGSSSSPASPPVTYSATVVDVGREDASTSQTVVDLRIPQASGSALAQVSASGNFVVVALP